MMLDFKYDTETGNLLLFDSSRLESLVKNILKKGFKLGDNTIYLRPTYIDMDGNPVQNAGNIYPKTSGTYSLGSSTYKWLNAFLSGYADIGSLRIGGTEVLTSGRLLRNLLVDGAKSGYTTEDLIALALDIWKTNCFAYQTLISTEYYDFDTETWVDWGDTAKAWIDNNPKTEVTIDYEHRRFRFILYGIFSWAIIPYFVFKWGYTGTGERDATVTIESSPDGSSWVTRKTATVKTLDYPRFIRYDGAFSGHSYVRITIDIDLASGETARLTEVVAVNTRWGSHSVVPIATDYLGDLETRGIYPDGSGTRDLGKTDRKWKDGYFSGFLDIGSLRISGTEVLTNGRVLQNIASIAQNLLPDADNSRDLGSSTYRWKNGWFAGDVGIGTTSIYNPQGWDKVLDILGTEHARLNVRSSGGIVTSIFSHDVWNGGGGIIGTETVHRLVFATGYVWRIVIDTSGNMFPHVNNTYDLGSASYRWKNGYFAGAIDLGSLKVAGTEVLTSSRVLQNIASVAQTLLPDADNTRDLGSSSYRWRDLYLSDYIRMADGRGLLSDYGAQLTTGSSGGTWQVYPGSSSSHIFIGRHYDGTKAFDIDYDGTVYAKNMLPESDNSRDLGSLSYRWKDAYIANRIYAGATDVSLRRITHGTRSDTLEIDSGWDTLLIKGRVIDWTGSSLHIGYERTPGDDIIIGTVNSFRPKSNNAIDLGSSSYRWKSLYLSGNINMKKTSPTVVLDYSAATSGGGYYDFNSYSNTAAAQIRFKVLGTLYTYFALRRDYFQFSDYERGLVVHRFGMDGSTDTTLCRDGTLLGIDKTPTEKLDVNGYINADSGLKIAGTEIISSALKLQNISSVVQSLLPDDDETYNLGSTAYKWLYGFFQNMHLSGFMTGALNTILEDLAVFYTFEEGSGTTVYDLANDINGTINGGATWTDGKFGKCLQFNGTDAYVAIPDSSLINLTDVYQRTFIVVFKANDTASRQVIYEEGGISIGFNIYIYNNTLYCGFWGTEITNTWLSTSFTDTSDWHILIFVFDGTNGVQKVFLDFVEVASSSETGYVPSHSGDIGLGAKNAGTRYHDGSSTGTGDYFNGYVDLFMTINHALITRMVADAFVPGSFAVVGNLYLTGQAIGMRIENRTSDPASPAEGQIWIRTDL